jgi:hypothetical protein
MRVAGILAVMAMATAARAADSAWLLCDNGKVALNVYEHRATADTRATDLTLLHGGHTLAGKLVNSDSGAVALKGGPATFKGTATVDYAGNRVVLKGKLALAAGRFDIDAELACKEMDGHL